MISYNNVLILRPYTGKRGIQSVGEKQGFARVQQKTTLVGLELLADAQLSYPGATGTTLDGIVEQNGSNRLKKGQTIYFKEEDLHNCEWATRTYSNDIFKNGFVLGEAHYIVMVK